MAVVDSLSLFIIARALNAGHVSWVVSTFDIENWFASLAIAPILLIGGMILSVALLSLTTACVDGLMAALTDRRPKPDGFVSIRDKAGQEELSNLAIDFVVYAPVFILLAIIYQEWPHFMPLLACCVLAKAISVGVANFISRYLDWHNDGLAQPLAQAPDESVTAQGYDSFGIRNKTPILILTSTGVGLFAVAGIIFATFWVKAMKTNEAQKLFASANTYYENNPANFDEALRKYQLALDSAPTQLRPGIQARFEQVKAKAREEAEIKTEAARTGKTINEAQKLFAFANTYYENNPANFDEALRKYQLALDNAPPQLRLDIQARFEQVKAKAREEAEIKTEAAQTGKTIEEVARRISLTRGTPFCTLRGHAALVLSVAFSPDGKMLASGSFDNTVKLWNLATGQELRTFEGHKQYVNSVAFSPDGKTLASGSYDGTVRLWNPTTGQDLRLLRSHTKLAGAVAFNPDGKILASGSFDVIMWNPATGQELRTLRGHDRSVHSVAFSPDGKMLAAGSYYDNAVILWNPATGQELRLLRSHTKLAGAVVFSPDGKMLASGGFDVILWNPATGQELRTLRGHKNKVASVAFSPDGRILASASYDSTVKLWDPATGQEFRTPKLPGCAYSSVAFSLDGRMLASGSYGYVELWAMPTTPEEWKAFQGCTVSK